MDIIRFLSGVRRTALSLGALAALAAAAPATANIFDDFERANAAALGNGWVEKNAAAFSLASGTAAKGTVSTGYRDNIVYRPAAENVADVEVAVELRALAANPGYPQIFARVQTGTVAGADQLDGYMIYVNNSATQAILGRQRGNAFVTALATLNLSSAFNTTDRFRLRLRAAGTNPVQLDAWVERLVGATWTVLASTQVLDSDAERITGAGSVGFGGYIEDTYTFDNFVRTNLSGGAQNPVPVAGSLAPSSANAGENGLTLTVLGSGFGPGSTVRWNGADRATTVVSSTVLEAAITAGDLANQGTANVTVFNPTPGGGTSNALQFTVNPAPQPNPTPSITSLSPSSTNAGGAQFTLTVNGSSFASTAVVRWNGLDRTTTFVSPTQVRATILASDIAAAGTASVRVFNPAPGGGLSNALTFTINTPPNPVPTIGALNPSSTLVGSPSFTLVVTGTGYVNGSTVRWNGSNRTTQFISSTELRATIPSTDVATTGTRAVTVFSPTPGGGTSNSVNFTVTSGGGGAPVPFIASLSPVSAVVGSGSVQVTIDGAGFTTASVARLNGSNRTTQWLSAAQLRVTLTSTDIATAGLYAITVQTPAPGGGTTQPMTFFVVATGTQVFFDGFNRPNSNSIGNNWTEKQDVAFSLTNNEIVGPANATFDYHDTLVYRPVGEDRRDVEVGIEFVRGPGTDAFPQVHARLSRNWITLPDTMEGYILFLDDSAPWFGTRAVIAAQPPETGRLECSLLDIPLPSAPVEGQRYRLRFRVTGVSPILLTGFVDRYNGTNWQLLAQGTLVHDNNTQMDPDVPCYPGVVTPPITSAGAQGFAKWETAADNYDNFYWMDAPSGGTSTPIITSLSPSTVVAGSGAFTLTVNGSNFASNSVVRWNGSNRTTTFVNSTRLTAQINAADVATQGTASVTVATGSTSSTADIFTISAPVTPNFTDSFDRADSAALGNGWLEKNVDAFGIGGNAVVKGGVGTGYRDNVAYRPAGENLLNVESSVELRLLAGGNPGYPQVLTRIQTATVGNFDTLDGYILYVSNSTTQAILGRQQGNQFVIPLATLTLSTALTTGQTYRMRVSASGTSPVRVTGFFERRDGANWTVIGSAVVDDASADRITGAGSVGFGGYVETGYTYDNFTRSVLP